MKSLIFSIAITLAMTSIAFTETEQTTLLKARNAEFKKDIVKVTDGVYCAVGYRASTINMIVGKEGIIIVDTGQTVAAAEEALAEFRKITDKPIKAVILTPRPRRPYRRGKRIYKKRQSTNLGARKLRSRKKALGFGRT